MKKEDINPPEPGELPPRISFVEQMGGSAGYYIRFKDLPEEEGGPFRKYVPILQYESQENALQAALELRDKKAQEFGLAAEPERSPHPEETRAKMSKSQNRLGLRGLGLTLTWQKGTAYPVLRVLWSEEGRQQTITRGMASRGIHGTMEELAPHLREHLHPNAFEEDLVRKGAEGTTRRLLKIARSVETRGRKQERIESLLEKWAEEDLRDRELLESLTSL